MNLLKRLGTALALWALPLAGCKDEDDEYDLLVEVRNEGTSTATLYVHLKDYGEWDDFDVVQPGETWYRTYRGVDQVNVEIRRSYDGLVLFSDSLRQKDFDDVDGRWVLVVHP